MSDKPKRKLTPGKAIERLERLAEVWPEHLELFSWSGTLIVLDTRKIEDWEAGVPQSAQLATIDIRNGGGDPMELYE